MTSRAHCAGVMVPAGSENATSNSATPPETSVAELPDTSVCVTVGSSFS